MGASTHPIDSRFQVVWGFGFVLWLVRYVCQVDAVNVVVKLVEALLLNVGTVCVGSG